MQHSVVSPPAGPFPAVTLKRSRSGEPPIPSHHVIEIPKLPDVGVDLILEVFTHKSLGSSGTADNTRLAMLGRIVLDCAVTFALHKRRPFLDADDMEIIRATLLSDENVGTWVNSYNMLKRIRCVVEFRDKLNTPEEARTVFNAYAGAIFAHCGQDVLNRWIQRLLKYQEQDIIMETPPAKRIKNEQFSVSLASQSSVPSPPPPPPPLASQSPQTQTYSPTAPYLNTPPTQSSYSPMIVPAAGPARQIPPHMNKPAVPAYSPGQWNTLLETLKQSRIMVNTEAMQPQPQQRVQPVPSMRAYASQGQGTSSSSSIARHNPLAPATPGAPFLPLFNQTAAQRGVRVEYPAAFSGPQHAGQWHVRCVVNGITKGEGTGNSKQIAKEAAAREAYYKMGWT